jgi:hypothetical protein
MEYNDLAAHGLAHKPIKQAAPPKHTPEARVKKLHSGGYTVEKMSGKPGDESTHHGAKNLDEVSQLLQDHMGAPAEGAAPAAEAEPGAEE